MSANDDYIAEILTGVGLVNHQQATAALVRCDSEERSITEILVEDGITSEMDILKALANK